MNIVCDILDTQLLDRDKHLLGRADGVVLEIRDGQQPRVVYLEMGAVTLSRRLGRAGRWLADRIASRGRSPELGERPPFRIAWDKVRAVECVNIVVDIDAESSRAFAWERWLAAHVIAHVPGGGDADGGGE